MNDLSLVPHSYLSGFDEKEEEEVEEEEAVDENLCTEDASFRDKKREWTK